MRHPPALMGTFRLLAAALQLTLPGAAAWADARLDAAATHATPHIESHTTDSCARIHPPDCALCSFLTTPLAAPRPGVLRFAVGGVPAPYHTAPAGLSLSPARAHPHPRAPPPVS